MSYVLIIDGDKWYGKSVANLIDAKVKVVNSSELAIGEIDKELPGLIFIDINLGTKNGFTVLNELQSWTDTRQIPVVLMSADVKSLNLSDLEKYGVVDILDKSDLTPEKLKESLKNGKFTD